MEYDESVRHLEARVEQWRYRTKDADERKTYDEVFDERTLLTLQRLISGGIIDTLDYPVSTGKEGNVFKASREGRSLAVKIYRISNATFTNISRYLVGDPRFPRLGGNRRKIIHAWAQKEFKNLKRMAEAGVRVPRPVKAEENVLVMGYVGDKSRPAVSLRQVIPEDPEALAAMVVQEMRGIQRSSLVHGDLSEYNLLLWRRRPWVIDVGQAVPLDHPRAEEWFMRDVTNISRYFERLGVEIAPRDLAMKVRGG